MTSKVIPAAEARKRMAEAESSLRCYKSYLQMAGLESREMRQQINSLLYELDGLGVKRLYQIPKVDMFGGGEYDGLLAKYVELLGAYDALKKSISQMPTDDVAPQRSDNTDIESQKTYSALKKEYEQLADQLKIEKEKRAKAGRRPRIKHEVIERIIKLHEQGLTQAMVAKEVGYSVFTVNRVIHGLIN